jgi:aspartate racemase
MDTISLAVLGLGSRATSFYLSELNNVYNAKKGGFSSCPLLLLNTDFDTINSLLPNTSTALDLVVKQYTNELEKLQIEHLLIPNITLHETIDRLKINQNLVHPISLSIKKIKEKNWKKVVLFGSLFSMNSAYIQGQFKENGIEVMIPSKQDMVFIDSIRKHIYNNTETAELITKYQAIINKYSEKQPVILACTELSILKPKGNKNVIDMADVQIEEAVKLILK